MAPVSSEASLRSASNSQASSTSVSNLRKDFRCSSSASSAIRCRKQERAPTRPMEFFVQLFAQHFSSPREGRSVGKVVCQIDKSNRPQLVVKGVLHLEG